MDINVTLTKENYQQLLLVALKSKNWRNLKRLSEAAAHLGIADPGIVSKMSSAQWEQMLWKLRSTHFLLTEEERQEAKDYCDKLGIPPIENSIIG